MCSANTRSRARGSAAGTTCRLLHGHHPAKPGGFSVRRILGAGNLWVTEYVINYQGKAVQAVSIMEFQNGKVIHETQHFAEPFPAPTWRRQWVEHAT
jgi:hypothetical protein